MKKLKLVCCCRGARRGRVHLQHRRRAPYVVVMFAGAKQWRIRSRASWCNARAGPAAAQGVASRGGHRHGRHPGRCRLCGRAQHTALVIGHGGHIVFEKYWDDTTLDSPVDLSGFTPVLSALCSASAMNDERSINLDAPLGGYIAEWADDPRGAISLRQLLTRSSGFAKPGDGPGRDACGELCVERRSASGAARMAARCGAEAG